MHSAVVFTIRPKQPDCVIATKKMQQKTSIRLHICCLLAVYYLVPYKMPIPLQYRIRPLFNRVYGPKPRTVGQRQFEECARVVRHSAFQRKAVVGTN